MTEVWQAIEYGEVGVSFSFTVWTVVSWGLLSLLVYLVAQVLEHQRKNANDMEGLVAVLAALTNETSGMKIPETRQALHDEIKRRGWEKK